MSVVKDAELFERVAWITIIALVVWMFFKFR
jgi:hypothetical protein